MIENFCSTVFKPPACVGRFPHEGFSQGEPNSGTQHFSRLWTRRSEAVNSTEMHFIDEVSNPFRNLNAGPLIERLETAAE